MAKDVGAADVAFFSAFAFAAVAGMMLVTITGFAMLLKKEEKSVCMFGSR
jgi:hypothetical protein